MSTTFTESSSIPLLGALTYLEVRALALWCAEATGFDSARYKAHHHLEQVEAGKRRETSERSKKVREELTDRFVKWAVPNLKEGTRMHMKGCRDRHGIRIFMNWGENKKHLICRQVRPKYRISPRHPEHPESLGQITEHYFDKVSAIYVDGTPVTLRKFMEGKL